jgi:transcriptional regulator with XRE-family HTH domain
MNTLVANKLKHLRKQKALSQEEVAEHLHVSQSTYARMETGESNSWASYIDSVCSLFEIQPEELLKQEQMVINQSQQGGESNNAYIINQLSGKLIEQYEARLEEKDMIIERLRLQIKP